jgi:MutS-like protein
LNVNPRDAYLQRQAKFERERAHYASVDARLGPLRLLAAALIIVTILLTGTGPHISGLWLLLPVGAFIALVAYHVTIRRKREHAERGIAFYDARLARIEDRWTGTGVSGDRFNEPHHVYASDLDLFGRGSLFELLCAARTRMGEESLARWLLAPASAETVRARQAAVAELRDRLDLREDFALEGDSSRTGVQPEALLQWAAAQNELHGAHILAIAIVLPALAIAGVVVAAIWGTLTPFLVVLAIEGVVLHRFRDRIKNVIQRTEAAFQDLRLFAALLMRIERETFNAPALRELVQRLSSHTLPASTTIAKLSTLVGFVEARRNIVLALFQLPLLYPLITSLAAERWRRAHGAAVAPWIEVLGEIEALASLAAYAYEHPDDPFPEIVDGSACFEARSLGHLLIPVAHCVRNDVSLGSETRVLLVSGSNMSGKSTLLRTIGVNTVLAMTGAPVRAASLRLTPLQVGASIRINDSLHEGSSRFYAEITRLKQLVQLMDGPLPLLFLLDELLQGTNSKDRRAGAEGIVRAFMQRGAIGLVSTHDLALTDFELPDAGALRNVHFEDAIVDGKMTFDFRLREGVVTRSNGIELMRSIGLKV